VANLTIAEAAVRLGITKEALRTRVRRRQIESFKDTDGQWRVVVPDDASPDGSDIRHDADADTAHAERGYNTDAVIAILREQLAEKDRQIRELHVLLQTEKQMTQRLLEAGTVPEAVESRERPAEEKVPDTAVRSAPGDAQRESAPSPRRRGRLARLWRFKL
jgi:hypothetical protein